MVFGVDVGGSGVKGAPVDLTTGTLAGKRTRIPTPQPSTPAAVTDAIVEIVRAHSWEGPVGVTVPGVVRNGVVETGANIDIDDTGAIKVYGESRESAELAIRKIEEITAEAEVGKIYEGKVTRCVDFGAFVEIMPGTEGLLHISQIAQERVEKVTDYVNEGDIIKVKVLDVDQRGRIKLSMKEAQLEQDTLPQEG